MSIPVTVQGEAAPDIIDFSIGHPSPSFLPLDLLQEAARHRLGEGDPLILQYGFEQGDEQFRRVLADFLSRQYASRVGAEQLFISGGASQALDLICTLYTRPGDLVFVEEPTYFLALRIFADHRLEVQSVATDGEGLIMEELEEMLRERHPVFLYSVPTHQNPSGVSLPLSRRRRLVELSEEHGFLILADEVYHLLTYKGPSPQPFGAFGSGRTVFSLGSFSKILAPGLRLGWIQASAGLLKPLVDCGLLDSGGGLNPFCSAIVRSLLELGRQDEHLKHLRRSYGRRLQALSAALQRQLGGKASFRRPSGGYFIWIRLPEGIDTEKLLPRLRKRKVGYLPGAWSSSRRAFRNYLRLSFSFYEIETLEEGVGRLGEGLRSEAGL